MTTLGPASKLASLVAPMLLGLAMVCGLLFLFGGSPLSVAAAPLNTPLSGNIIADTTLTSAMSPYTVTGVVNIQAKLTISPGVEVRFLPDAGFQVNNNGQLEAIGAPAQPILFTSDSATPARGDWNGITFEATSLTGTIQYAVIEYSKIGVELNSTTVPNIQFNILSNTFRFIGSGSSGSAAVIGSPDDTNIRFNTVFSSSGGILLNEIGRTIIANNEIFDIDNHCIAVNSTGAASSDNQISNNQIHDCGARGIWLDGGSGSGGAANQVNGNQVWNTANAGIFVFNQSNFNLRTNEVFSTALNNTVGAVILNRANMSTLEDNYFHDNGVPGIYEGALHIVDTGLGSALNFPLQITGSRIKDSLGSGLIFSGTNQLVVPQTIDSNAICVDDRYEIENRSTVNVTAQGNWFGTNTPMVGTEITGTVQFNPFIQFSAASAPPIVPADGLSTAVITVTMNDGAGNTMPVGARQITLTTNLGSLANPVVTLDANGVATTTITSNVAGTAIISLTEWCDVTITTTVEFQDTDLSIQKSAVSTQASPGSTITYTLTYSNDGALATNVVITDTLPAGAVWVSDTAASLGFTRLQTTPDVVWTIANLPATSSGVFTVVAQIPASASATCGQTLTNTAVITSATADSDPSNNTAIDSSVNVMCSDVGITKSSVLTQVVPGEIITYTIPYSNAGNTTAINVVITDTLPTGAVWLTDTAESLGFTRLQTAPEVVWSMASLGANISDTIVLVAQVQPAVGCGQVLTNSVVMTTTTADSDPTNQNAMVSVDTVCPDVTIVKTGPAGTLSSGQQITYTLTYSNIGQGRASNVVITDTSPITGGVITLTSGISLDPNTAGLPLSYSITVPDSACGAGALTNTAYISTSSPETNTGNNVSTVSNPVICTDLVITKTATSVAPSLGRVTTFTIAYQNTGTMTATNVIITDTLDAITQYVTDTLGGASLGGGIVTWNIGDLGPGVGNAFEVGIEITPPVACPPSGSVPYTNTVFIDSDATELVTSNNVSTATVSIPCGDPDLVVIKNDRVGGPPPEPSVVLAGGLITYTISYNNIGGATATNVVLTETLPANTIFVGPPQWTGGPSVYTRTVLDVPSFSGGVVNFVVQVAPTLPVSVTVVNNQVQIGSAQPDAYPPDNVSNEQTPVQAAPDLTVAKRTLSPFAVPGGLVTYAITVTNQGSVNAASVVVTDTLPTGTTYISNTVIGPPGSPTSPLAWNIGALNAGQSQNFELTVQTDNGICSDLFLVNTVEARSTTAEGDYTNNITSTNALNSPAIACEELVITKTVASPALSFGRVSTFTIAYQNAGIVTMTNTVITDALDSITQYVTDTLGGAFVGGGNVIWNIGDVAPGTGGSFDIGIEIDPATTCPASGFISFTNTALIGSDVPELVTSNNVSTATV
ncbi:MAG TPA: right-handed parallel beta-helix repeat-containing protein, partial [Anaerolineae bacterium]